MIFLNRLEKIFEKQDFSFTKKKIGFLHPKEAILLFDHYNLLKDDLPDGQDFEDFLDEFKSIFKNF